MPEYNMREVFSGFMDKNDKNVRNIERVNINARTHAREGIFDYDWMEDDNLNETKT